MPLANPFRKNLATSKLIQSFRKFVWGHLWVTVANAANLKEID